MDIQEDNKAETSKPEEQPQLQKPTRNSTHSRPGGGSNISISGGYFVNPKNLVEMPPQKYLKSNCRISLQSNVSAKGARKQHSDLCQALIQQFTPNKLGYNRFSIEQTSQETRSTGGSFGWVLKSGDSPIRQPSESQPTIHSNHHTVIPSIDIFKQNSFSFEQKRLSNELKQPVVQPQKFMCKCVKSKCLQLYCQCFSKGVMCSPECVCYQCRNNQLFKQKVEKARDSILTKDPEAFSNKLQIVGNIQVETNLAYKRGCNCKRTMCTKKYCECVLSGVKCTYLCKCENCMNGGGDKV